MCTRFFIHPLSNHPLLHLWLSVLVLSHRMPHKMRTHSFKLREWVHEWLNINDDKNLFCIFHLFSAFIVVSQWRSVWHSQCVNGKFNSLIFFCNRIRMQLGEVRPNRNGIAYSGNKKKAATLYETKREIHGTTDVWKFHRTKNGLGCW